jgi:hypothetical protein
VRFGDFTIHWFGGFDMLFHITQTHTPENCPKDSGGSKTLYDSNVEGLTLKAVYGAFAEHEIYFIVETDDLDKIQKFLLPGFKRCTCKVTAVAEAPIVS